MFERGRTLLESGLMRGSRSGSEVNVMISILDQAEEERQRFLALVSRHEAFAPVLGARDDEDEEEDDEDEEEEDEDEFEYFDDEDDEDLDDVDDDEFDSLEDEEEEEEEE